MTVKIEWACQEVHCYLWMRGQNQQRYFTKYIHPQPLPQGWQSEWIQDGQTAQVLQSQWESQWRSQRVSWRKLYSQPLGRDNLRLYQGLTKVCYSILTQICTGKTGLTAFLHQRRIPGLGPHAAPVGREQRPLSTSFFTVNDSGMQGLSWRILGGWIWNISCVQRRVQGSCLIGGSAMVFCSSLVWPGLWR